MEYMNTVFLRNFGNKMGNLFKIDVNTAQQARGRFARLCVEIDLNKLLKTYIRTKKKMVQVRVQRTYMVCFDCGLFGHTKEGCTSHAKNQVTTETETVLPEKEKTVKTTSTS